MHITFLMLPTKNYKCAFKFVKVTIWNTVSFFTLDTKNNICDDVIITSSLRSDMTI